MKTNDQKVKELQEEIETLSNLTIGDEPLKDFIIKTNKNKIIELTS